MKEADKVKADAVILRKEAVDHLKAGKEIPPEWHQELHDLFEFDGITFPTRKTIDLRFQPQEWAPYEALEPETICESIIRKLWGKGKK